MRPSSTSTAPSRIGGEDPGMRVPAAKITGPVRPSGIPPDHLRGHRLQELAFRAVGQEGEVSERSVDLALGPLLGPGDGVRDQHSLYALLEQCRGGARVGEDAPDRPGIPLFQRKDDGQRHGAFYEVGAYAL